MMKESKNIQFRFKVSSSILAATCAKSWSDVAAISFEDLIQIFHNNVYQIPNYKVNYVKIDKTYNISNWIY